MSLHLLSIRGFLRLSIVVIGLLQLAIVAGIPSDPPTYMRKAAEQTTPGLLDAVRPAQVAILAIKLASAASRKSQPSDPLPIVAVEPGQAGGPQPAAAQTHLGRAFVALRQGVLSQPRARSPPLV